MRSTEMSIFQSLSADKCLDHKPPRHLCLLLLYLLHYYERVPFPPQKHWERLQELQKRLLPVLFLIFNIDNQCCAAALCDFVEQLLLENHRRWHWYFFPPLKFFWEMGGKNSEIGFIQFDPILKELTCATCFYQCYGQVSTSSHSIFASWISM